MEPDNTYPSSDILFFRITTYSLTPLAIFLLRIALVVVAFACTNEIIGYNSTMDSMRYGLGTSAVLLVVSTMCFNYGACLAPDNPEKARIVNAGERIAISSIMFIVLSALSKLTQISGLTHNAIVGLPFAIWIHWGVSILGATFFYATLEPGTCGMIHLLDVLMRRVKRYRSALVTVATR